MKFYLIWAALSLVTGIAPAAYCQYPADPPGLPSEPPVYECEAMYVPIMVHARSTNPNLFGWSSRDCARESTLQYASSIDLSNSVLALTLFKPMFRPMLPPLSVLNPPPMNDPKRRFGLTAWRLGESRGRINPPIYGLPEIDTGWFDDVDRVTCVKVFAPGTDDWPPFIRDRYEGEQNMTTLGFGPGEQNPYAAMQVLLKVQNGTVVGAGLEVDYGTDCTPAYSGAHACTNPACARFGVCETPWVYPNVACGTCGQPGVDVTREDVFVSRHASPNMLPDAQGDKWERPTLPWTIPGGGTITQMHTTAGTPYMAFSLIQEIAYSTDPGPYNVPGRVVPKWDDGLYFIYLDHLRIRKGSSAVGIYADLRIRMWRLYEFSASGAFAYLTDWFADRATCDLDGDQCVAVGDLFAFLERWFQ